MEQNADAGASMTPVAKNKQKGGNGLKIATVITCVVAVCGIGFGVYSMMQSSQKDNQVSDLQNQINTLNDELSSKNNSSTDETTSSSSATNNNSKDYLYIGEWDVKIKIPDGLYIYDYKVKLAETTNLTWYDNAPHIIVSGFTQQLTSSPSIPEECYSLIIARTKDQTDGSLASYDGYSYSIGTDVPCLVETGYSKEDVDLGGKQLIKEMFSDINNYSRI
ncbi:hypothetical protein IJH72_01495 [Candidatus Saccharibacteria bacterium]|nr:hypothetical protein [Candidatus Saccharibacteria bacterium]MBR0430695.1 hypothetical protein [Candidatus Saccharibacteria bacterium]